MAARTTITVPQFPVPENQPLRRAVRRLRWFKSTFEAQVRAVSDATDVKYAIDAPALTRCFLEWLRGFEAQKPTQSNQRRAYVGFSAGLMLQKLIANKPLTVESLPGNADEGDPAYFWPEGYVYVAYCLNIRREVLEQEFHEDAAVVPEISELRTWWSFRENVSEDSSTAIPFLDLFAGNEPEWELPARFQSRGMKTLQLHINRPPTQVYNSDG